MISRPLATWQVVMITQASADSSVCVAVAEDDAEIAMRETEKEFAAELDRAQVCARSRR